MVDAHRDLGFENAGISQKGSVAIAGRDGVLRISVLVSDFRCEIQKEHGGENITSCFVCGICSASCPVREVDDRYPSG